MSEEISKEKILEAILEIIEEINEDQDDDAQLGTAPETVISGEGSPLDSMAIINFIVLLEKKLAADFGKTLTLIDDENMFEDQNPLASLSALCDYIADQLT